ncbi:hypothetical protein Tco_1229858 [Tanacetum coccineum]
MHKAHKKRRALGFRALSLGAPRKDIVMPSDSAYSIVSYTSISSKARSWSIPMYVLEPDYPEYLAPSDDDIPVKDQPLHADASPTALSPGYVADSDLEEDPEEDPIDYTTNADDEEEEEESSEDDD